MRPGHLSSQKRASGRNVREYTQLSYTFQKRSRTDYVQPDDLERIKAEIDNYRKFKDLCERLVELSIEESKRKTRQRRLNTKRKQLPRRSLPKPKSIRKSIGKKFPQS